MKSTRLSLKGWKEFLVLCRDPAVQANLEEIFDLFFTPEEKENLSARYLIIDALLKEKFTQREMADSLQVSISQITRGSNALKRLTESAFNTLERFFKDEGSS